MSRRPVYIAAETRQAANIHRAAVLEHHGRPVDRLTILTSSDNFLGVPYQGDQPAAAYIIDTGDPKATAYLFGQLVARGFEPEVFNP